MLKSMTGFGKGTWEGTYGSFLCEVKSINSKSLDLSVKLPRELSLFEGDLKNTVQKKIQRGKVDVFVQFTPGVKAAPKIEVNYGLAEAYFQAQKKIAEDLNVDLTASTRDLFSMPDVFRVTQPEMDDEVMRKDLLAAAEEAVDHLYEMRLTEGENLTPVLGEYLGRMKSAFAAIEARAPFVTEEYAVRLRERIEKLLGENVPVDEQRLAQEIAFFADKANIDEEISRIRSHLLQLDALLASEEPVGRELDFLVQEFKREINTLGSKSNDTALFANVLTVKGELEKFREQIQNIE